MNENIFLTSFAVAESGIFALSDENELLNILGALPFCFLVLVWKINHKDGKSLE